jgi:hypothetical protein
LAEQDSSPGKKMSQVEKAAISLLLRGESSLASWRGSVTVGGLRIW